MSVTLTDRDTGTIILTQNGADATGINFSASGGTLNDYIVAKVRHSGMESAKGVSRHNFRLERRIIDATSGVRKVASVDITVAVPNDGSFTADQVDDLLTAAPSYFASEAEVASFITGGVKV